MEKFCNFAVMKRILAYTRSHFPECSAMAATFLAFIIYLLTVDSSVSYWDCPEYVLTASTLQTGHPPGNPVWILMMRIATLPFAQAYQALVINICSALLMAGAAGLLTRITYRLIRFIGTGRNVAAISAMLASLCFAVLDSTWFSAVEAEVYAFSTFLTTFTIWLMLRWTRATSPGAKDRLLILLSYVSGLSLGVHQLNLLVLPVLALIWIYHRHPRGGVSLRAWITIALSFILVALILLGLMPGAVAWAAVLELFCINHLHLPLFTGVIIYPLLMIMATVAAVVLIPGKHRLWAFISLWNVIWLSGIFLFKGNVLTALLISMAVAAVAVVRLKSRVLLTAVWMLAMVWTGYSAIGLILIRGYASPPVNEGAPSDIFSLQRYISREQYGSKPLLYGATPYSRPMRMERIRPHSPIPDYSLYALKKEGPRYNLNIPGARLSHRSRFVDHADSLANKDVVNTGHGYLLTDYRFSQIMTPELDMFLPRITSRDAGMMTSYADWAGMTPENMQRVEITSAIDSAGKSVGKLSPDGKRLRETALRPTYMQHLRFFLTYQLSYMYLRYLGWNFIGRQNDLPATGEIDRGNVITGIRPLDTLTVGDQSLLPPEAGLENPGRHTYFAIPFIIGLLGIIFLMREGSRGRRVMAIVTLLFLMTGVAIVVYLNQDPGQPRERDYAFIGSYMAFCIWIASGLVALCRIHKWVGATAGTLLFILLLTENYPDHDRSGRYQTRAFALNTLAGKERDIIFSYGDNFSFPLWYAQEVEGASPEATVIDVSYLSTPEYVMNLLKQGSKGISLTATPADIAFGAYAFTRVAPDADTVARPLIEILRELYTSKEGNPTIRHTRAIIPGRTLADTLILNLRQMAGSNGTLSFRTLMLLDILATNLDSPSPRPLSFLTSVRQDLTFPLRDVLLTEGFSDTYAPAMERQEYVDRLIATCRAVDSTSRVHRHTHPYADPVIADQMRRQRGAVARSILPLFSLGEERSAQRLLSGYPELFPEALPGSFTVSDTTFHETLHTAILLLERGDSVSASTAVTLLERARKEAGDWLRYYSSLPATRRHTVSNSSRRLISTLPRIDSLLQRGKRLTGDTIQR